MTENHTLEQLLKKLLKQRSMSMRNLSEYTKIDAATISRIINGKRKATPEHLRKIAKCLEISATDLFVAAGYFEEPINTKKEPSDDLLSSIDTIQKILESANLLDNKFSLDRVKNQLAKYEEFSMTLEGRENILKCFKKKLQKVGSIGPFITQLKEMYKKFRLKKGTPYQLAIIGGALLYFIVPVDVIPDFVFPIGYLDDALAVQLVLASLSFK